MRSACSTPLQLYAKSSAYAMRVYGSLNYSYDGWQRKQRPVIVILIRSIKQQAMRQCRQGSKVQSTSTD